MFRIKKRELGVGIGGKVWKRVKGVKSECDGGKGKVEGWVMCVGGMGNVGGRAPRGPGGARGARYE